MMVNLQKIYFNQIIFKQKRNKGYSKYFSFMDIKYSHHQCLQIFYKIIINKKFEDSDDENIYIH